MPVNAVRSFLELGPSAFEDRRFSWGRSIVQSQPPLDAVLGPLTSSASLSSESLLYLPTASSFVRWVKLGDFMKLSKLLRPVQSTPYLPMVDGCSLRTNFFFLMPIIFAAAFFFYVPDSSLLSEKPESEETLFYLAPFLSRFWEAFRVFLLMSLPPPAFENVSISFYIMVAVASFSRRCSPGLLACYCSSELDCSYRLP